MEAFIIEAGPISVRAKSIASGAGNLCRKLGYAYKRVAIINRRTISEGVQVGKLVRLHQRDGHLEIAEVKITTYVTKGR